MECTYSVPLIFSKRSLERSNKHFRKPKFLPQAQLRSLLGDPQIILLYKEEENSRKATKNTFRAMKKVDLLMKAMKSLKKPQVKKLENENPPDRLLHRVLPINHLEEEAGQKGRFLHLEMNNLKKRKKLINLMKTWTKTMIVKGLGMINAIFVAKGGI